MNDVYNEKDDRITANFFTTKEDKNRKGFKEVLANLILNGIIFGFDEDGAAIFYTSDYEAENIILEASKKYPLVYFFWSASREGDSTAVSKRFCNGEIVRSKSVTYKDSAV